MTEGAIFLNSGPLLSAERIESLEETPIWGECDDATHLAFEQIKEAFEKHATLLAGNPSADETRYFMVNAALHALGFMHSADERVDTGADTSARVDYALFAHPDDFREVETVRGTAGFFRPAVGIVHCVAWGRGLDDVAEYASECTLAPGQELDLLLRATGMDYGILSNGCDWRIYHRATSSLLNTWFQADMIAAIKSDFEDFKRFFLLFGRDSLVKDDSGESFVDRLLQ